jgi:hypothetical protein
MSQVSGDVTRNAATIDCRTWSVRLLSARVSGLDVEAGCSRDSHSQAWNGAERIVAESVISDRPSIGPGIDVERNAPQQQHGPTVFVQQPPGLWATLPDAVNAEASLAKSSIHPVATRTIKPGRSWWRTPVISTPHGKTAYLTPPVALYSEVRIKQSRTVDIGTPRIDRYVGRGQRFGSW